MEDHALGNLAAAGDREESASHHVQLAVNRQPGYRQGTRRASYCVPFCFLCVFYCDLTEIIIFGSHMTNFFGPQLHTHRNALDLTLCMRQDTVDI